MKASIKFHSRAMAKDFATLWGRHTLTGHDMAPAQPDGTVTLTLYNVTEEHKAWIDARIASLNAKHSQLTNTKPNT